MRAYSLGGGTYTGIEAVSNGLPIMREPRVQTGKRTMLYMAASLALTASGLLLCYLLWHVQPVTGQTMNAVLIGRIVEGVPLGGAFVVITLLFAEAMLLVVAAQAGFSTGRGCWPTWRWTRGCRTGSRPFRNGSRRGTGSFSWAAPRSPRCSTPAARSAT